MTFRATNLSKKTYIHRLKQHTACGEAVMVECFMCLSAILFLLVDAAINSPPIREYILAWYAVNQSVVFAWAQADHAVPIMPGIFHA